MQGAASTQSKASLGLYQSRKIPTWRAAFDSGGVVGLKRPDLRLLLRRSGLLSPTSTSIQVRTFRLWYYLGLTTPTCLHMDSSRQVEHFGRAAVQMNLPKGTSRSLISIQ